MSGSAGRPSLPEVTLSESRGVRYLHLDTPWIQGAMRIDEPDEIVLEYVQRMMVWMLFRELTGLGAAHAVQLGLGAGAITRFCSRRLRMRTTAVEVNRHVIDACRLWFRLPADGPRLGVLEMDAARFAADPARRGTVDVLSVDLYDHDAASPVLDSAEFYADCHRLLAGGGLMTVNLFGREASFDESFAKIAAAFAGDGRVGAMKPTPEGNTVVLAMKQVTVPDRDTLAGRAENIETRWQLPARKWLRMIAPSLADSPASRHDRPPA